MKLIENIVLAAAAIACASEATIAQTKPVRVCTTELNIHPDEDFHPGAFGPPPIHMRPQALPPDFSVEATAPDTVLVTVPVEWREKGFEARLQQEECDFVVLTWWEYRGFEVSPTLWPSMLNDDINPAWSMPMQAAPVDGAPLLPISGAAAPAVPMQPVPANIPLPPSAAKWLRHFELDGPGFQRVLMTKVYPYPEKKVPDIAKQMGMEIFRVIDSRPRIENLSAAAGPSKLLPSRAAPAPLQPEAREAAGTTGHLHRGKLNLPEEAPHAVVNGHNCTPGDPSDLCKHICGGAWGPCKDVQEKLRLEEEHFSCSLADYWWKRAFLSSRSLFCSRAEFKGSNPSWMGCPRCTRFGARLRPLE